jgi:translocation and assembly module TamB
MTATVTMPDLARLGPPWGGAVTAEARFTAAAGREGVTLTATATDLRTGVAEADGLMRGPLRVDAAASREGGTITLDRLTLDGRSLRAAVTGSMSDVLTTLAADLTLPDLGAAGPRFGGRLAGRATLRIEGGTEAVTLDARTDDLRIGQAEADRLLAGPATLAVAARRTDGVIRLDRLRLEGRQVTAEATARSDGAATRADVTARIADLALLVPGVPGPLTLAGTVDADAAGYGLDLALRGPGGIDATARGRIAADARRATLRAQGRAEAALANAFIAPVSLRGPVTFDVGLDGPLTPAALTGRIALTGGRVALANPPLAFADSNATVTLGGGRAQIDARARNELGGSVTLRGAVGLVAPFAASLETAVSAFVVRDPNLYATSLSGQARVDGPLAGGARIAGAFVIGPTELRIPSSGLGGAAAIPDLRHLSEPPPVRATRARAGLLEAGAAPSTGRTTARPYPLDLDFTAGRIFIRGRGLDAELGGTLSIQGTSAAPIPVGGFELIRGRLDLLGKRFDLGSGKLYVEGDFIPRLELAATSRSDDITATIAVEGRADEPTIRFRSTPELPEEEVVARLLFGRGLQSLSAFQAAQLAMAVATLTGRGGMGLVDRLRRSFGLDDFDVQTGGDGAAAFRAGKYIAENIYADVVFGAQGKTEVTLNLDVSPTVTVRGRAASDGTTGIGIYFERDY